jgi:hypothetical protein
MGRANYRPPLLCSSAMMLRSFVESLLPTLLTSLALVGAGCDSDGAVEGARGSCAQGGAIGTCPQDIRTAEGACDRLVACAAIARDAEDENGFDWGRCVEQLQRMTPTQESFVIACIGGSSCDDLKVEGSPSQPNGRSFCFEFGDR